jgi:hypothetical protein
LSFILGICYTFLLSHFKSGTMDLGYGQNRKSPTIARWLSIIPGLGHLYAGAYISGIIRFIVFLVIIYLFWELFIMKLIWYLVLFFMFVGIPLVSYSARSASKYCAEINSRKAMNEEFSAKKRTQEKVVAQIEKEKAFKL